MSIQFERPMNEETRKMMEEFFRQDIVSMDDRMALINSAMFEAGKLKALANAANQPCTVELHEEGEIKTMSDGTQYRVTPQGWRRITP